jgi:hypothetical protein
MMSIEKGRIINANKVSCQLILKAIPTNTIIVNGSLIKFRKAADMLF